MHDPTFNGQYRRRQFNIARGEAEQAAGDPAIDFMSRNDLITDQSCYISTLRPKPRPTSLCALLL